MLTAETILAEIRRRIAQKTLRNKDVAEWLGLPDTRATEIRNGRRQLKAGELPILAAKLWPDGHIPPDERHRQGYDQAVNDVSAAMDAIVHVAGTTQIADMLKAVLPPTLEAIRRAREDGIDPHAAAVALARYLWPQALAERPSSAPLESPDTHNHSRSP